MGLFGFAAMYRAWQACRRRKQRTHSAQGYELRLLDHLVETRDALQARRWSPGPSVYFVTLRPKAREAAFFHEQRAWFQTVWPEFQLLLQKGRAVEVTSRGPLGLAQPREVPLAQLAALRRRLRVLGIPHLFVAEEGRLRGGLKRRFLRLAWTPARGLNPLPKPPLGVLEGLGRSKVRRGWCNASRPGTLPAR